MKIIILLITCWLCIKASENDEIYEIPDIHIGIVTSGYPRDGHLRLYRNSKRMSLHPKIIQIKEGTSEIKQILDEYQWDHFKPSTILIITISDQYLVTREVPMISFKVAKAVLKKGGQVVMAYPRPPITNTTTKFDEEIDDLLYKMNEEDFKEFYAPRPTSWKEYENVTEIFAKLKKAVVKREQALLLKASSFNPDSCAFAGVKNGMLSFLEKARTTSKRTLKDLCIGLADDGALRHELGVIIDDTFEVFKQVQPLHEYKMELQTSFHGTLIYQTKEYKFSPMTFGSYEKMPFALSNFMSGEVIVKKDCSSCLDKPFRFDDIYPVDYMYPIIHIMVIRLTFVADYKEFVQSLKRINYPRNKIKIDIFMKNHDIALKIQKLLQDSPWDRFSAVNVNKFRKRLPIELYQQMWKKARGMKGSDYVVILDPQVRLSEPNIMKILMQSNKRVIGPLMTMEGDIRQNYIEERVGHSLMHIHFAGAYETNHQATNLDCTGLIQVPYLFGLILIKKETVNEIAMPFEMCVGGCALSDVDCFLKEEINKFNCHTSYYDGLGTNELALWGMMVKQIQEKGTIPYLTNEYKFGTVI